MKKKKKILIALVGALLFLGVQSVKAQDVSSWSELKDAIQKGTTPINLTTDITNYTSEGLGTFGGSLVTINGNRHNINGNDYKGITVAEGQTLNIDNAGNPANENAKGFNGFNNGIRNLSLGGGVILNHGTTTITGSSFTGNNSDFFGGAIYNKL